MFSVGKLIGTFDNFIEAENNSFSDKTKLLLSRNHTIINYYAFLKQDYCNCKSETAYYTPRIGISLSQRDTQNPRYKIHICKRG